MTSFRSVVLAAGMGTRMRSNLPKVLHEVLGLPMVSYPVQIALDAGADEVAVVVGHGRAKVEAFLDRRFSGRPVTYHEQTEMLGTADAVRSARPAFAGWDGAVLILYGDVPNLPPALVDELVGMHRAGSSPVTMLSAVAADPASYGRVERGEDGTVIRIVEFKDADDRQRAICEVNIGVYLVDRPFLEKGLAQMDSDNAQGEFYLTDLVEMAYDAGLPAQVLVADDIDALHGVNTRAELARAETYARERRNREHMLSGVTMIDPQTAYVDFDAVIEQDARIGPNVVLRGKTVVRAGATIDANASVVDSEIGGGARVGFGCVIDRCRLEGGLRYPPLTWWVDNHPGTPQDASPAKVGPNE